MTTLPIPGAAAELTAAWLTDALRAGGVLDGITISDIDVEVIGEGIGLMGQLARVTPRYDGAAGPATIIAKFPAPAPENLAIARMMRFYEREVLFYQQLAEDTPIATARCYYSALDQSKGQFVLLLEDLGAARAGDQVKGCTAADAESALREVARMHARWWQDPRLEALAWLPPMTDPLLTKIVPMAFRQAWPTFLEQYGDHISPDLRALGDRFPDMLPAIALDLGREPQTMVHGDFRLDNFFFGREASDPPISVVDWQICFRARGPYDVGYLLSQSLDPADRRAHERDIVGAYHDALLEGGVRDYDFEQCWEDYRRAVLFCFVYPVIVGGGTDVTNERASALANAIILRSVAAMEELSVAELAPS